MRATQINEHLERKEVGISSTICPRMQEEGIIELFPNKEQHKLSFVGGALTQAAGYVFTQMKEEDVREVLRAYFSPDRANYGVVRIPIDSCDFSTHQYSAASSYEVMKNEEYDFSMDEKYIFPFLDMINEEAGKVVPILFSPWSPQAFLKTNNSRLKGGFLKREHYREWAHYVVRYVMEYQKRGYKVYGMTMQNEPNAIQTWDSCLYSPEEEREYLLSALKPELEKNGLGDLRIYYWDHNKERLLSRAEGFVNDESINAVYGVAVHGYCGDHFEALTEYRRLYPTHDVLMTEFCMVGAENKNNNIKQLKVYGHEVLNDLQKGASGFVDWNLILDKDGGPNHVGNYCMAPFVADDQFVPKSNMAYEVLSAASCACGEGAVVISHTKFDSSLDVLSVKKADGSIHVVIGTLSKGQTIHLRIKGRIFSLFVKRNTLTYIVLEPQDYSN